MSETGVQLKTFSVILRY